MYTGRSDLGFVTRTVRESSIGCETGIDVSARNSSISKSAKTSDDGSGTVKSPMDVSAIAPLTEDGEGGGIGIGGSAAGDCDTFFFDIHFGPFLFWV
jgi:hypothetical protein